MTEDATMEFVLGEATEVIGDIVGGDFESVIEGLAFGELRESRSGGNSGGATVGLPADIFDGVGGWVDLEEHFHLVTADGVADEADGVGFKFGFVAHEDISGIQKVFFDDVGINPRI